MGVGIGYTGLNVADVDADGTLDIVAAAGPSGFAADNYWYVLSRDGSGYSQKWVSLPYSASITAVRVAQVDADAPLEILVASGSNIYIYDGATRALQSTITTASSSIYGLTIADVDRDGALELVFCNISTLYVVSLATGVEEFRGAGLGGKDVAVGQVDADAALEIVVANITSNGYVIDGATHAIEWTLSTGFGDMVRTGDFDGDGREEIAAGFCWTNGIRVYNADTQTLAWSVAVTNLDALRAADVEGDGILDLVYGDAQWGSIHILDARTGAQKWAVSNPQHGVTDIGVGDVDRDGVREILWGAGYSFTGPDYLYVADSATHLREWNSQDLNGPFYGLGSGDVDNDGTGELLYTTFKTDDGYNDGLFFIHDAGTKALEYQSGPIGMNNAVGVWRIESANVDADPQPEIFTASGYSYQGVITCYDGLTHAQQWQRMLDMELSIHSMALADVDNDGKLEVVVGMARETTVAAGVYVYIYDAETSSLEWESPSLGTDWLNLSLLRVANVDEDPNLEIVVADLSGALWILDPVASTIQLATADLDVTALDTPDRNGDGKAEVVIGTAAGAIKVLDAATGAVVENVVTYSSQINGLSVIDATYDGQVDYVFASGDQVRIFNRAAGIEEWTSGVIGSGVGAQDSLLVADVDADSHLDIVVNVGDVGLMVYKIDKSEDLTANYNFSLLVPSCDQVGRSCTSGTLLNGRGPLGPEPGRPNTIRSSCADGTAGSFHSDESNDRIKVYTLDGSRFAAGKTVRIEATVWAWSGYSSDHLDLYYAANANSPVWQYLTTLTPTAGGTNTLSATYVLPAGALQAVRARFRYMGSASPCTTGSYDDHDDLVFAVQ